MLSSLQMKCPFCTSLLSKVIDKRAVGLKGEIRRRRECLKCGKRFTTYEVLAKLEFIVIKKDGRKEPFVREKLALGIIKALEKRPGAEKIEKIVDKITARIKSKGLKEVQSQDLGKWVLSELKKLDSIAYLRFASVYRTFSDPKDFKREMETL